MSHLSVFVVEDNATIRQNLVATLEEMAPVRVVGYAETADGAIAALGQGAVPCDLAIVDLMLRRGSGIEVLAELHRHANRVRRVVLTNHASPHVRQQCLALGAERVFDKSGEVEGLLDYCEALAANCR
jgi:DNA-binding NarL/FixJ family response regulator